jgi:hypothetical protein
MSVPGWLTASLGPPVVVGLLVGGVATTLGILVVVLLVRRANARAAWARLDADVMVWIPPSPAAAAPAPRVPVHLPPPPVTAAPPPPPPPPPPPAWSEPCVPASVPEPRGLAAPPGRALAFVPSTALSARAFAKMGYAVATDEHEEVRVVPAPDFGAAPDPVPDPVPAPDPVSAPPMRAAPIGDLSFDDGPTEIAETCFFDEPSPRARRRGDPPKIRLAAPAGPRYPDPTV